ncbi:hypothetical protein [Celeribacter sp. SCSIO 80788]|uniref:hypothetical protein n=1 Tax=Celeribacter sp. SCSIO 80788 TaxID=3117013 RepID=UPI003DA37CCC
MTPQERKSLAEQINSNPLFHDILDGIEKSAVEMLIYAETEKDRIEAQERVRAARSFRSDLRSAVSTPERKGAPV